jgi:hypothetical protein
MPFIRQAPIEQFADDELFGRSEIPLTEPWDLGIDDEAAIEADLPEPGWDWDREFVPYWQRSPADWREYRHELNRTGEEMRSSKRFFGPNRKVEVEEKKRQRRFAKVMRQLTKPTQPPTVGDRGCDVARCDDQPKHSKRGRKITSAPGSPTYPHSGVQFA